MYNPQLVIATAAQMGHKDADVQYNDRSELTEMFSDHDNKWKEWRINSETSPGILNLGSQDLTRICLFKT